MGFLDKVKNLFTEEVEEPVVKKEDVKRHEVKREIQKQERKVEIAPARRETVELLEEEKEEISIPKREEKPLPIYFSDDDFADLEKPKKIEEKRENRLNIEFNNLYNGKKEEIKKEEKKYFKPSPIISPVYGILDKNYKKDDITTKEVTAVNYRIGKVTVDDIRNKAYGVLEDDLESNLLGNEVIVENNNIEENNIDIFEELETREEKRNKKDLLIEDYDEKTDLSKELEKQKQQIEEINEIIKNSVSPDKEKVTSRKIDNILEELDEIEEMIPSDKDENIKNDVENNNEHENMNMSEENENNKDELEESDLFNLIDSMYEKRDE